jgi:hypothetical protein
MVQRYGEYTYRQGELRGIVGEERRGEERRGKKMDRYPYRCSISLHNPQGLVCIT